MRDLAVAQHWSATRRLRTTMNAWQRQSRRCGSLDLHLERASLRAGETVRGFVRLRVDSPIVASELVVILQGQERLHCVYSDGRGGEDKEQKERTLVQLRDVLSRSAFDIETWEFPFSFEVPLELPPSTALAYASEDGGVTGNLKVVYSIEAKLYVRDQGFGNVEQQVPLVVLPARQSKSVGKPTEAEACKEFRHALGFKKTSCRLRVRVDSDVYRPSSMVIAHVWLDLKSPERLRWISLSLFRRVDRRAENASNRHSAPEPVRTMRFDKDALGNLDEFVLRLPLSNSQGEDPLQPTSDSLFHHVSISHSVVVICKVKGCDLVAVEIPVTIEHAQDPAASSP